MNDDSGLGDSINPGNGGGADSNTSPSSSASSKGSNAGQSPIDVETVDGTVKVIFKSPDPYLSIEQQAMIVHKEMSERLHKYGELVKPIIEDNNALKEVKEELGKLLKSIDKDLDQLKKEKSESANQLCQFSQMKAMLLSENEKMDKKIRDHQSRFRQQQAEINSVRRELETSREEIKRLKEESKRKDGEINMLKSENKKQKAELEGKIKKLEAEMFQSYIRVDNLNKQVAGQGKALKQQGTRMEALGKEKKEISTQLSNLNVLLCVSNDIVKKTKNFVFETFLTDKQRKLISDCDDAKCRQQQNPEGNAAGETPGTSSSSSLLSAGQKRKAGGKGKAGIHVSNSKIPKETPKKPGSGDKN